MLSPIVAISVSGGKPSLFRAIAPLELVHNTISSRIRWLFLSTGKEGRNHICCRVLQAPRMTFHILRTFLLPTVVRAGFALVSHCRI